MLIIAHRGASAKELENTRAAFKLARDLGADGIELDVHASGDGEILVHHDPKIDGVSIPNSPGTRIRQLKLENGETVPALDEALDIMGTDCMAFVELKTLPEEFDDRLIDVLSQGPNPKNYRIHSFDHRIIRRFLEKAPSFPGGILSRSHPIDPIYPLVQSGAAALWQEDSLVDKALVDSVHKEGFKLYAWTVDDEARAVELRDIGVDGICTNTPDVIRRAVQR